MDPNLSQLDPKIREAYQNVLNGQSGQSQQTSADPQPQNPTPNPAPTQPSPVYEPPTPAAPIQTPQPASSVPQPTNPMPVANPQPQFNNNFAPNPAPTIQNQATPIIAPQPEPAPVAPAQPATQAPQQTDPVLSTPTSFNPPQTNTSTQAPMAQNIGGAVAFNASGQTQTTVVKKGGRNIMHILLGLGAVVFLVAYTFIWIFIFKIRLPFLPA